MSGIITIIGTLLALVWGCVQRKWANDDNPENKQKRLNEDLAKEITEQPAAAGVDATRRLGDMLDAARMRESDSVKPGA